jgi:hypothetical protein
MQDEIDIAPEVLNVVALHADTRAPLAFTKVGGREGSNPGGWYRKNATGELFYFKFYENSDNAHVEYVANCIYRKLGIRAASSELFVAGGDLWTASKKIGDAVRATKEEQQRDHQFKNGFVADAYLCNWDVVGEFFDNVIKDAHGHLYRIDNGACGPVRATGKSRPFPSDSIVELDDMRTPAFEAGQIFQRVTERDLTVQALHLLSHLDNEFLETTYRNSGMSGDAGLVFLDGLRGRREYLRTRFGRDRLLPQGIPCAST